MNMRLIHGGVDAAEHAALRDFNEDSKITDTQKFYALQALCSIKALADGKKAAVEEEHAELERKSKETLDTKVFYSIIERRAAMVAYQNIIEACKTYEEIYR